MLQYAAWNGKIVNENDIVISPNNRSFRYGDGCFETMKIVNGEILLQQLHFQRLFSSLDTLRFQKPPSFTAEALSGYIKEIVQLNGHSSLARVRLTIYRGDGSLYDFDNSLHYIIQSWAGNSDSNHFNAKGFQLNIFADAKKTADLFSPIKSNNYLPYIMAAIQAKEQGLDDCIVCNAFNRIAEATIANIFIVTNGIIKTPLLSEGCVNGVMRKYLVNCFKKEGIPYAESEISVDELLEASEVFLTNATYGIRWVEKVGENHYKNATSTFLHQKFITPLFNATTF